MIVLRASVLKICAYLDLVVLFKSFAVQTSGRTVEMCTEEALQNIVTLNTIDYKAD